MTPNTNITALLVFASTRGYGEQEFAARLILAPKPRLVNSKHRQGAWLGTELSRQRCGSFLSKVAFETLVTPLIQKENPDPFTVKYVNSVYSARASKLVLGKGADPPPLLESWIPLKFTLIYASPL